MEIQKRKLIDFFEINNIPQVPVDNFYDILAQMINNKTGSWLTFGVGWVYTFRELNRARNRYNPGSKFFGFDGWQGLPENWRTGMPKGTFAINPEQVKWKYKYDPNVIFIDGLFDQTLNAENKAKLGSVSLINIDCDLYSSTKTVLERYGDLLKKGTIIIFDEFYHPENEWEWWKHEALAFYEYLKKNRYLKVRGILRRNTREGWLSEAVAFWIL